MKKGWRNDLELVERRERLQKERCIRRMEILKLEMQMQSDSVRLRRELYSIPRREGQA